MSELIISVSGLRGIIGETLDPVVAARYIAAFAAQASDGEIVVARDGRTTGPMLKEAVIASLRAAGRSCIDFDVAATPTVGVAVREFQAAGAVQISASHNPPPYNGIKLFGPDGRVLDARRGAAIRDSYQNDSPRWVAFDKLGGRRQESDSHAAHQRLVLATVDQAAIRAKRFRVLLDSNHGAGSVLGKPLLEALGCDVVACGGEPNGMFAHPPEPTEENLQGIAARVREEDCVVGFCQDPDADRLALIDADGRYIGEEFTVALCVQHALSQLSSKGPVVINCATSSMTERLAEAAGVPVFRSAVGEANVADRMIAEQAAYGGEGNGGPIDPRVGYVRDSFVGMAQILDLMQTSGKSLAELANSLPQLAICKTKTQVPGDKLPAIFEAITKTMPDAATDRQDGLRLTWPDRWLLIRGSNTEPIVRFIAEAPHRKAAEALCQQAAEIVETVS